MHPALQRLLVNTVKFRPPLPLNIDGPAGFGPETVPVRCRRSQPERARRRVQTSAEAITGAVDLYLDGCDFDPTATPVGSLVNNGGDTWQLLIAADPFFEHTSGHIAHWRLRVGVR